MTVLSYAKHAPALNQKRFRQIDNEQYNYDTQIPAQATLEFYIIINLILRLSCRLSNSSTKSSKSIFSVRTFSTDSKFNQWRIYAKGRPWQNLNVRPF